jgi:uncharacterized repeat protein (TIGR01451 family)
MELLLLSTLLFALALSFGLRLLRPNPATNNRLQKLDSSLPQPGQVEKTGFSLQLGYKISACRLAMLVAFATILGSGLLALWLGAFAPGVQAQGPGATVGTAKTLPGNATSGTFLSGEEFIFNISYSCATIIDPNCTNVVITDTLDPALEFLGTSSLPSGATASQIGNTIVIDFGNLDDGDTGVVQVRVRFALGTLPGITATNVAAIDADNANPTTSNPPVTVTADGSFQMTVNKGYFDNEETGTIGTQFETIYHLNVCNPNNGIGGVPLNNPIITDTLPAQATPILPIPMGGTYLPGPPQQLVWQAGVNGFPTQIPVTNGCFTIDVPVYFDPATSGVISGTNIANQFQANGNPADNPATTIGLGPVGNTITLRDPFYDGSLTKSASTPSDHPDDPGVEELPGGPVTYGLNFDNEGTLPITNLVVTDIVPTEIVTITVVAINPITPGQTVTFSYELDNSGTWILGAVSTTSTNINLSGVPGQVTGLRWELGAMPFDAPAWNVTYNAFLDNTLTSGDSAINCVTGTGVAGGNFEDENACAQVDVIDQRAIPRTQKLIDAPGSHLPEEVVTYTLRVYNDDVAHNNVVAPITLADLLPEELELVVFDSGSYRPATPADSWYTYNGAAPSPTAVFTPTYGSNNETLLRWQWAAPYQLPPGEVLEVSFSVRIKKGTPPGDLDNVAITLWDEPATVNELDCVGAQSYTDTQDVDGDGLTGEVGCQSSNSPTVVGVFLSMASEKFVLGELDGGIWNKDGVTIPGGRVDYQMIITNQSNVTATNLVVYDIFPFVGDTGVIDPQSRDSDWRPNLQTDIEAPPGVPLSIQYSQAGNPCRPEVVPSGPAGCTNDWSSTPPADLTSVQAVRLEFCEAGNCLELPPDLGNGLGGTMVLTWHMQAPNDAPAEPERAWNSFGFTAQGGGLNLLPAEPNKVGIRVRRPATDTINLGNYVWLDVYGQQNDGVQQPEESGINGVRVELRDENGNPVDLDGNGQVDFRITGPDAGGNPGYYLFVGLPADITYTLRFYPPVTYTLGPPLPVTYNISPGNSVITDEVDSDGITPGVDATYGPYIQTGLITTTLALTTDLRWDQGLWLPTDYGDAPNSYNTQASGLANPADAARHVILPGIHMGADVDDELDGDPTTTSFGDDTNDGNDDENGVTFDYFLGTPAQPTPVMIIGDTSQMTVTAAIPAGFTGYLNAWIDFNDDGDFDDAGEQIATDQVAPNGGGAINLSVAVPTTAISGTTYARFRFSTESGLGPSGGARDGEVEDYPIILRPGDFGDLPNTYGTLVANNGARHVISETNNPTLGSIVDDEFNGQPATNADGDDNNDTDDEDGVVFNSEIIPGEVMTVTVTASPAADGLLNAWIDFNGDGDFNDANERLATDLPIAAGNSVVLTTTVPVNADQNDEAYARFRFSSQGGLQPTGLALDGEVEDYAQPILSLDYGDLPNTYPTQYASNGARHVIDTSGNPTLGNRVDAENNGQPNANATGDDNTNSTILTYGTGGAGDDEDGVNFNNILWVPGKVATITVSALSTASGGADGLVNAWIDFNNDGDLNDAGEQVATNLSLAAGTSQNIVFTVPANAFIGNVYSRFRFSSNSDLTPSGLASDGEVEDYRRAINQLDYGDAPDSFGTTDSVNGAFHIINSTHRLGTIVDAETNGQPSVNADGDDTNNGPATGGPAGDDEDGIIFNTPIAPGAPATITVRAVGSGNLNGWIDFNGNGVFDASERIFNNTPIAGTGSYSLSFTVPATATLGTQYARFRYSSGTLSGPTGQANNGEVEDYVVELVELDYGDLPDSSIAGTPNYLTTLAADGARHIILAANNPTLGSAIDSEPTGQPSSEADGDDLTGLPDDEDGIRFLTPLMPGETAQIEVTSTDGILNGWIDFNGDGDFNDAGEHIFDEQTVNSGTQVLTINVPAAVTDTLYSRFRLTANTGEATTPAGLAPNGEVEDYVLMSLGNQVWLDGNNDGLINGGEPGITGVTVTLVISGTSTPIATTVTDSNGNYLFTGLTPGDYQVTIPAENFQPGGSLFGYKSSTPTDANADNADDGDDNGLDDLNPPINGITSNGVTLSFGSEPTTDGNGPNSNLTVDFGFYPGLRLGNLVWFDLDNDGQLGVGENGVPNVVLTLLDGSGNVVNNLFTGQPYTTTTDASGLYLFTNLVSGTYQVRVDAANFQSGGALEGYTSSDPTTADPNSGVGGGIDNDDNGLNNINPAGNGITSGVISLIEGDEPTGEVDEEGNVPDGNSNLTVDFGFYELLSLGNLVWYDADNNGQKDAAENGIANVTLALLDGSGNPVTDGLGNPITTTTNSDGEYLFTGLVSGAYRVEIVNTNFTAGGPLEDFISSTPTEPNADSDDDNDDNGVDNPNPAVNGISSGPVTLAPLTEPDVAVDGNGINGNQTVDFGFFEPLRLGNQVWLDESLRNGQLDFGETGVENVVLNLLDGSGAPVLDTVTGLPITTTTDSNGFYLFTNLVAGTYIVEVDAGNFQPGGPLEGYLSTTPTQSDANDITDSDDNGLDNNNPAANGIQSGLVMLAPDSEPTGEVDEGGWPDSDSNLTVDFGFILPASLGDYVWVDSDGDGEQDGAESGVNGVTVRLWADTDGDNIPDTVVLTTTTTTNGPQNGYYQFTNLIPDLAYQVEFELPAGYEFTAPDQVGDTTDSDANPGDGFTGVVFLAPGENNVDIDAGVYRAALELDKRVAIAEIVPNQVVTYTIIITNTGNVRLDSVAVTDTLAPGLTYVPGSASPPENTVSGQQLIWDDVMDGVGLAPGASTQITLLASVTTLTGTYQNTALGEGFHPTGSITDTDTVPVVVSDPAVTISKEVVAPGAVDGLITFTLRLVNTGPSTLDQVPLFDQFSGPVVYIGGNVPADTVDNVNRVLVWNDLTDALGDMAPGQVFVIQTVFRITVDSANFSMTNAARVAGAIDSFGNQADEDTASVTLNNEPTAIELLYFEANRQGDNIIVNWGTAIELDNYGFRLLRSTTGNRADAVEITFVAGQGQGTASGAAYTYVDKGVDPNQTYTYWLVDVDLNGQETDHGPVTVAKVSVDSGGNYRYHLPIIVKDN